jgi:prepilin-type N-terminal cleavage/methylation domain-containing protein
MQDHEMKKNSGFTLIEIVLSLAMLGFMSIVAGMGIVSFTKGFVFVKKNIHVAQKSQLAMARLNRELMELSDIDDASVSTEISFKGTSGERTIGLDDSKIKIAESPTSLVNGNVLIDNVDSFTISYYQDYPGQTWEYVTDNIDLLSTIRIELNLIGVGGTFSTIVFPRNK